MYAPCVGDSGFNSADVQQPRIDWDRARRDGDVGAFEAEVRNRLQPFLNSTFDNVDQLNQEFEHVAQLLKDTAVETLPVFADRGTKKVDGEMLP